MESNNSSSLQFPTFTWKFHRNNGRTKYLEAFDIGAAEHLLPRIGAYGSGDNTIEWEPASFCARAGGNRVMVPRDAPAEIRPPTKIPGFLSKTLNNNEVNDTERAIRHMNNINIPWELLNRVIKEDNKDSLWDKVVPLNGNLVATSRPYLLPPESVSKLDAILGGGWQDLIRFENDAERPLDAQFSDNETRHWLSNREWSLYAGGECNTELWGLPLPRLGDENSAFPSIRFRTPGCNIENEISAQPAIEFSTPIKQIITRDAHPGIACVRTMGMVGLVNIAQAYTKPNWSLSLEAELTGIPYTFDDGNQWTCHASLGKWNRLESAMMSLDGSVWLWDFETGNEIQLQQPPVSDITHLQWGCCEYWTSPRQILCANPDELYFLDARESCKRNPIVILPESLYTYESETFTAAMPSALHPMHAIAVSTHAVRVFDQRYSKQPMMIWQHKFPKRDPPRFIQSDIMPSHGSGCAASITIGSVKSARIANYVYGQMHGSGPYVSIDQSELPSYGMFSSIQETIQERISYDLHYATPLYKGGVSPIESRPSMIGFSLRILPQAPNTTTDGRDAVCIMADEYGAVVGQHISVYAGGIGEIPDNPSAYGDVFKAPVWQSAQLHNGMVIDGVGVVLKSKDEFDSLHEQRISGLRSRSVWYDRLDWSYIYDYLLSYSDSESVEARKVVRVSDSIDISKRRRLEGAIFDKLSKTNHTVYDVSAAIIESISNSKYALFNELPSWTKAGQDIRKELLQNITNAIEDDSQGIESNESTKNAYMGTVDRINVDNTELTSHETSLKDEQQIAQALASLFNAEAADIPDTCTDSGTSTSLISTAILRAAQDFRLGLSKVIPDSEAPNDDELPLEPAAELINSDIDSRTKFLTESAALLSKQWFKKPRSWITSKNVADSTLADSQSMEPSRKHKLSRKKSAAPPSVLSNTQPAPNVLAPRESTHLSSRINAYESASQPLPLVRPSSKAKPPSIAIPHATQKKVKGKHSLKKTRKSGF